MNQSNVQKANRCREEEERERREREKDKDVGKLHDVTRKLIV